MAAAVKTSPPHSSASSASSPEATTAEQAQFPTQKRKGGRKPVYATQEERKMRNRAAQAGKWFRSYLYTLVHEQQLATQFRCVIGSVGLHLF